MPTERPVVKLRRKEGYTSDRESLVCEVYGFYPKEIDVFWKKDGEVWLEDTFYRKVALNPDGTYHAWISVEVDAAERGLYRCHVEHDSLPDPVVLAWEERGETRKGEGGRSAWGVSAGAFAPHGPTLGPFREGGVVEMP